MNAGASTAAKATVDKQAPAYKKAAPGDAGSKGTRPTFPYPSFMTTTLMSSDGLLNASMSS